MSDRGRLQARGASQQGLSYNQVMSGLRKRARLIAVMLPLLGACQPSPKTLAERLQSPDAGKRGQAIRRLGELGPGARPAVPELRRFLTGEHPIGELEEAATALGLIGDPQAIPELVGALRSQSFSNLEWCASAALARIGPPAVPALIEALDDGVRRFWATNALKLMGPPAAPALPAIERAFASESVNTVFLDGLLSAAAAIAGDPKQDAAIKFVCAGLHHPEPTVRRSAARSIGDIGRRGVERCPDLAAAAQDANEEVARYARQALTVRH